MSAGLSKLATVLTVVFVVSLAVLIGDLLYVLWRRQRFRRRSVEPFRSSSKELLYFFCSRKNHSRIEPDAVGDPAPPPDGGCVPPMTVVVVEEEEEEEEDEVAKWQQGLHGHGLCRFLFTIKEEEEKEELEFEKHCSSCEENGLKAKRVCLKDRFEADQADHEVASVVVEVVDDNSTTPFSTPCASPPYYTPSSSPSRDETTSLVTAEIDGGKVKKVAVAAENIN